MRFHRLRRKSSRSPRQNRRGDGLPFRFDALEERRVLATFANMNTITINDNAAAALYPSAIVANSDFVTATVVSVSVTLTNISHTRPDDIDILLANATHNSMLMSDAGGTNGVIDVTTIISAAAASGLPDSAQIISGNFQPTNFDGGDGTPENLPATAPATAGTDLAVFNGDNFIDTWNLYVRDDAAGETGLIDGGWSLNLALGGDVIIDAGGGVNDNMADTFDITVTATHLSVSVNNVQVFNERLDGITSFTVLGSNDDDTINFAGGDHAIGFPLMFVGVGGTDLLNFDHGMVVNAMGDGLNAFGFSTVTIDDSAFSNNSGDGIKLFQCGEVTITNVAANNNVGMASDGIDIDTIGASVSLNRVTAMGNGAFGFSISNVSNVSSDATVSLSDLVLTTNNSGGGNLSAVDIANYTTDTTAMNVADTLELTATQFQRTSMSQQAIAYAMVGALTLNTADGPDSITVVSTHLNTATTVSAGSGVDTITVGNMGTLDSLASPITIQGGDGNDLLTLNDGNKATGDTYAVSSSQTLRTLGGIQVNYTTVESLSLSSGTGSDTFNVNASNLALNMSLVAGNGDSDSMNLLAGSVNTLRHFFTDANDGRVEVDGDATDNGGLAEFQVAYTGLDPIVDNLSAVHRVFTFSNGADNVTVSDGAMAGDNKLRISTNAVSSETVDFTAPSGTLAIHLDDGGAGADTFTFHSFDSMATATSMQVTGGGGNDVFQIQPTGGTVPSSLANLNLDGQAGNDTVPNPMVPGSLTLMSTNVAFTSMISAPATLNEGASSTLSSTSSADGAAPLTLSWDLDGDGMFGETGAGALRGNETGATPTYTALFVAMNTMVNVAVQITDADGDVSQASVMIDVHNTVPVASVGGPYVVGEGLTISLSAAGSTHPQENINSLTYNWDLDGDGQFDDAMGIAPNFSAAMLDGLLVVNNVRVRVTDADNDSHDSAVTTITINNVPPTADAGGSYMVSEGQSIPLIGAGNDVQGDLPLVFVWDLDGDGAFGETGAGALRGNETGANPSFLAPNVSGNQMVTVTLRVSDDNGGVTTDTATITVNDNSPNANADAGGPYNVNEGGTVALIGIGNGGDAPLAFAWDLDGDAIFGETGASATRGDENLQNPTFNASALDGPGSVSVTLRVTDADNDVVTDTATISVLNVPPTADAGGPYNVNEGNTVVLAGAGSDIAGDTLTFAWDLDGDGQFGETGAAAERGNENVQNPTFQSPFVSATQQVTVTLRVTDDNGGQTTDTAQITVTNTPPTANAGGPYAVVEGKSIVLAGSGGSGNAPLSFLWDFDNDGQFDDAAGAAPTFTAGANAGGTQPTIRLQVLDADGDTATSNVSINIVDASSQISGIVYQDSNNNGLFDSGEIPIPGATITISGTVNELGPFVSRSLTTNASGVYTFGSLQAGTYTLTETQPPAFVDGLDRAGTINGVTRGTAGNDVISAITMTGNETAINYNFGEQFLTHGGSGAASARWFLATAPAPSVIFANLNANLSAVLGPTPLSPPASSNGTNGASGEGESVAPNAGFASTTAPEGEEAPSAASSPVVESVARRAISSPGPFMVVEPRPLASDHEFATDSISWLPDVFDETSLEATAAANPVSNTALDSIYLQLGDASHPTEEDELFALIS